MSTGTSIALCVKSNMQWRRLPAYTPIVLSLRVASPAVCWRLGWISTMPPTMALPLGILAINPLESLIPHLGECQPSLKLEQHPQ